MKSVSFFAALAGAVLGALPASAELAPNYQRQAELRAVLLHPGVVGAFAMDQPIERIEFVRTDLYRVSAGGCHLDVAIHGLPTPPDVSGGRRFEVRPGKKICPRRAGTSS
jgi:hypothetical protein